MSSVKVINAFCLIFILSFSSVFAKRGWSEPYNIAHVDCESPYVTVDAEGNTFAVWAEGTPDNQFIQFSALPHHGTWSAPVTISSNFPSCFSPKIVSDPNGNLVAVWQSIEAGEEWYEYIVVSARLPKGGTWTVPETIAYMGFSFEPVQLVVNPDGFIVLVAETYDDMTAQIIALQMPPGGNWSEPFFLTSRIDYAWYPDVSIDMEGNATVVWMNSSWDSYVTEVYARRLNKDGSRTPRKAISTNEGEYEPYYAIVESDAEGNAVACWVSYTWENTHINCAKCSKDGIWSAPTVLTQTTGYVESLNLKCNYSQNFVLIWKDISESGDYVFRGMTMAKDGLWSGPETISDLASGYWDEEYTETALGIDKYGNAVAAWKARFGDTDKIQTATHSFNAKWSKPTTLVDLQNTIVSEPTVCVDRKGHVTCLWGAKASQTQLNSSLKAGADQGVQGSNGTNLFPPLPASNLRGTVEKIKFLTQTDIVHRLTWDPSTDDSTLGYHIYKNGKLIKTLSAQEHSYDVHRCVRKGRTTYTVAAFNDSRLDSLPLTIQLP